MPRGSFAALRPFVRSREPEERCDTCGSRLAAGHSHNFEPALRRVRCACDSCLVLYRDVYLPIPRVVRALADVQITDRQWDELMIPISLAFFSYSTSARRVIALYPGSAGAAESMPLEAWKEITASNPELGALEPDVQALLVNRVGDCREYFTVPIDECYKLVGLIRIHWRGLSGGAVVWGEIAKFFDGLRSRSELCQT